VRQIGVLGEKFKAESEKKQKKGQHELTKVYEHYTRKRPGESCLGGWGAEKPVQLKPGHLG